MVYWKLLHKRTALPSPSRGIISMMIACLNVAQTPNTPLIRPRLPVAVMEHELQQVNTRLSLLMKPHTWTHDVRLLLLSGPTFFTTSLRP